MRFASVLLLTAVLFASVAWAQAVDPAFQQAVDARGAARVANDGKEWGRYVTDNFIFVSPDGSVMNKAQRMAAISAGDMAVSHSNLSEFSVRVYGDTAIGTFRDDVLSFPARFMSVWVKEDDRWLCAHVSITPIENP